MSKRVKHSKIKNTGILFELLSRQITQDIISDDKKSKSIDLLKKYFNEKFKEIKDSYEKLLSDFNWNKLIFESDISFTPVIGKVYHLYEKENGKKFMSLISPSDWGNSSKLKFIGSFKQDSRQKWNLVDSELINKKS